MIGQPFEARNSKLRLSLLLAGAVLFVILGAWIAGLYGEPPNPRKVWAGWLCVVLFGFLGLVLVRRLFDDDVQVRIASDGIHFRQWSEATIPWDQITDVGVWEYQRQKMIVLKLVDPSRYPSSTMLGKLSKANRAMTGGDVVVGLTGTDRSFDEAMLAIQRHIGR